jgi:hypothetical protein
VLMEFVSQSPQPSKRLFARKKQLPSGACSLCRWLSAWDGTEESLEPKRRGHRTALLTKEEKQTLVGGFVRQRNVRKRAVKYSAVRNHVEEVTGKNISIQTIQRYGHAEKIRKTRTKPRLQIEGGNII